MSLATPAYAWNDWDIPGTYDVTSEKPATFVIAFVERDYQTGNNMTVTMIGESSERVLGFKYDNKTGEARMGGNIGDEYFDDLMYIKFDFGSSAWALRGEGYMRWGEKGAEKIPFTMVKTDGESEIRHPSAGDIEVREIKTESQLIAASDSSTYLEWCSSSRVTIGWPGILLSWIWYCIMAMSSV